jgi:hypothetical protein
MVEASKGRSQASPLFYSKCGQSISSKRPAPKLRRRASPEQTASSLVIDILTNLPKRQGKQVKESHFFKTPSRAKVYANIVADHAQTDRLSPVKYTPVYSAIKKSQSSFSFSRTARSVLKRRTPSNSTEVLCCKVGSPEEGQSVKLPHGVLFARQTDR